MAKAKKMPEQETSIVRASVEVVGSPSKLVQQFQQGDFPECTAVGMVKLANGQFVAYTVKFQGERLTSVVLEDPNNKLVALDTTKIAFVNNFTDQE